MLGSELLNYLCTNKHAFKQYYKLGIDYFYVSLVNNSNLYCFSCESIYIYVISLWYWKIIIYCFVCLHEKLMSLFLVTKMTCLLLYYYCIRVAGTVVVRQLKHVVVVTRHAIVVPFVNIKIGINTWSNVLELEQVRQCVHWTQSFVEWDPVLEPVLENMAT